MSHAKTPAPPEKLPEAGRKKNNAHDLEKLLDTGIEDSMAASDPPAVLQPEVHTEPGRSAVKPLPPGGKSAPKRKK